MINCNNLNDFLAGKGEVFADITESVKLFKKMKDQMEVKNVTMMSQAEEAEILAEIKVCKSLQASRCFSECKISSSTEAPFFLHKGELLCRVSLHYKRCRSAPIVVLVLRGECSTPVPASLSLGQG